MEISRRRLIEVAGAVSLTAVAGLSLAGDDATYFVVSDAKAADLSDLMEPGPMGEKWLGEENAPVTIIEYASMTCPHCANFHLKILPGLKEKFVETGKLRMIFREFPFDPRATAASMLAR